ncbi:MAG: ABC transporter ATP-binding protein [Alphaproteobacteria bacterium]|nr:ABC transporter ATP-binding protein [Alphaproteobacteria bacterium]
MTAASAPAASASGDVLLEIDDLCVEFVTSRGVIRAVDGISYKVHRGEIVAIVGESGCGKSVSSLAVMRLLAQPAGRIAGGRIRFDGRDLLALSAEEMRAIRGREIAMIFQEPMTSLNPVLAIGAQVMEPLQIHLGLGDAAARRRAAELLALVGITDPDRRLDQYPHQLSGGMRQRVMIAIALACDPKLLIADEPTTALDVTIQAQILELMKDLSRRLGIALVVITHNLGIVARYADRVNVMYAARIVESGTADEIFLRPRHPYTIGLMRSVPRLDRPRDRRLETIEGLPPNLLAPPPGCRFAPRCRLVSTACDSVPPLAAVGPDHLSACWRSAELGGPTPEPEPATRPAGMAAASRGGPVAVVDGLTKHFSIRAKDAGFFSDARAVVRAVDGVSFTVHAGETLGLVGESGCGKTTVGRLLLKLEEASGGTVSFDGVDVTGFDARRMRPLRREIQVIFQDPFASLNPRMTIGDIVAEPLRVHGLVADRSAAREKVVELLGKVGLYAYMAERYPHELSGGQRQRVGIARALAFGPRFIVCDEPVSALDVSIQAQIVNLLEDLQREFGLSYLFIAHDLAVVRHIAHRVAVMYLGRIMEIADRDEIYARPLHPYTQALLDAAPSPDPISERARAPRTLGGELPSPLSPPAGCVFHTRCPRAEAACRAEVPVLREIRPGHAAACIRI